MNAMIAEIERLRAENAALKAALQIAIGALADISGAEDMNETTRRRKANRIYTELVSFTLPPVGGL